MFFPFREFISVFTILLPIPFRLYHIDCALSRSTFLPLTVKTISFFSILMYSSLTSSSAGFRRMNSLLNRINQSTMSLVELSVIWLNIIIIVQLHYLSISKLIIGKTIFSNLSYDYANLDNVEINHHPYQPLRYLHQRQ